MPGFPLFSLGAAFAAHLLIYCGSVMIGSRVNAPRRVRHSFQRNVTVIGPLMRRLPLLTAQTL
jgi:hypothetical protein